MMLELWKQFEGRVTEDASRAVFKELVARKRALEEKEREYKKAEKRYEKMTEGWEEEEMEEKCARIDKKIEQVLDGLSVSHMGKEITSMKEKFAVFAGMVKRSKTEVLAKVKWSDREKSVVIGSFGIGIRDYEQSRSRQLQVGSWSEDWSCVVQVWQEMVLGLLRLKKKREAAAMSNFFSRLEAAGLLSGYGDVASELRLPMDEVEVVEDDRVVKTGVVSVRWKEDGEVVLVVVAKNDEGEEMDVTLGQFEAGRTVYLWPFVRKVLPAVEAKAKEVQERLAEVRQKIAYAVEPLLPYVLAKGM